MKALENSLSPGTMLSVGESPPFGSNKRSPKKKTLQRNLDLKMRKGASGNGRTIGLEFDAFRLFNAIINQIIDLNRIWETPLENACTKTDAHNHSLQLKILDCTQSYDSNQDARLYVSRARKKDSSRKAGWLAEPQWVGAVRRPLAHVAFLHS